MFPLQKRIESGSSVLVLHRHIIMPRGPDGVTKNGKICGAGLDLSQNRKVEVAKGVQKEEFTSNRLKEIT